MQFPHKKVVITHLHVGKLPSSNGCNYVAKAIIDAYTNPRWTEVLLLIIVSHLLAINEDRRLSAVQMVYGTELQLPEEYLDQEKGSLKIQRDLSQNERTCVAACKWGNTSVRPNNVSELFASFCKGRKRRGTHASIQWGFRDHSLKFTTLSR